MKENENSNLSFADKHPKLNAFVALIVLIGLVILAVFLLKWIVSYIGQGVEKLATLISKLDAVLVVALITATVSLISVVISSIVSKIIDYRKTRQEYLAKKREKPYGEFVDMIYKIQQNAKNPDSYTQEQMLEDLLRFSKQITLWGSSRVVKKWLEFRMNGAKPDAGKENLFVNGFYTKLYNSQFAL